MWVGTARSHGHWRLSAGRDSPHCPQRSEVVPSGKICRPGLQQRVFIGCRYHAEATSSASARRISRLIASTLAASIVLLQPGSAIAAAQKGDIFVGVPRIVDADTLVVAGEKVRLFGLDAPESKQSCNDSRGKPYACGTTATDALKRKIASSSIQCEVRSKDLYGRYVSSCFLPGTGDIGDWLVKNGHAVAYRQYSKAYVDDEEGARSQHKGIWQGTFELPADWRREQKAERSAAKHKSRKLKSAHAKHSKAG